MRYEGERRQAEMTADVVGRADRIVKIIQQKRKADTSSKGKEKRDQDVSTPLRADRRARRDGMVLDRDIIGTSAGQGQFLFFLPLRVCIQKVVIGFDLTFEGRKPRLGLALYVCFCRCTIKCTGRLGQTLLGSRELRTKASKDLTLRIFF